MKSKLTFILCLLINAACIAGVVNVPAGQVPTFAAGNEYVFADTSTNVNQTIGVGVDCTIRAANRQKAKFIAANGIFAFRVTNNAHPKFIDLSFDGSGITYDGQAGGVVDWCRFTNFQRGMNVGFGSGTALGHYGNGFDPQNWRVTNCTFDGSADAAFGGWAIGFFKGNGVWITDNAFINCGNGIKTNNGGALANDIHVLRNYMTGIRRMNAEMQGQVTNFELCDNYSEKTRLAPNRQQNLDCLGWSVIYHGDETRNVQIHRNTMYEMVSVVENGQNVLKPNRPDGTGVAIGFETGNNADVSDNYLIGIGTCAPVFMGDSSGPRTSAEIGTTKVHDNKFAQVLSNGYAYGQYPNQASFVNNGPNVQLSALMEARIAKGDKPGPGGVASTQPSDPVNTFAAKLAPLPVTPDVKTKGAGIRFTFTDAPTGAKTARIVARAKNQDSLSGVRVLIGTKDAPGVVDIPIAGADVYGFVPAWDLDVRVTVLDVNGAVLTATGWINAGKVAGETGANGSDLAWPPSTVVTPPPPPGKKLIRIDAVYDDGSTAPFVPKG